MGQEKEEYETYWIEGKQRSGISLRWQFWPSRRPPARGTDGDTAATGTGSIHGHVNNPVGQPVTKGEVRLITDRSSAAADTQVSVQASAGCEWRLQGHGHCAGNLRGLRLPDRRHSKEDKSLDFNDGVIFTSGDDKVVNFDMTRAGVSRQDVSRGQEGAGRIQEEECRDYRRQRQDSEPECDADAGSRG